MPIPQKSPHNHCLLPLLPPEILLSIADYLPTCSLQRFALTSRQLYATLQVPLHRRLLTDKSLRFTIPRHYSATALQWASFNGNSDLVKEMLATGVWEVDEITTGCTDTALCLAVVTGDEKTVKLLLRCGAVVDWEEAMQKGLRRAYDSFYKAKNTVVLGWVAEEALRRSKKGRRRVRE